MRVSSWTLRQSEARFHQQPASAQRGHALDECPAGRAMRALADDGDLVANRRLRPGRDQERLHLLAGRPGVGLVAEAAAPPPDAALSADTLTSGAPCCTGP